MDSIILRGLLEYFIRERVLVIGVKGSGKTKLIEKLMDLQYFDVENFNFNEELTDHTRELSQLSISTTSSLSSSSPSSSSSSSSRLSSLLSIQSSSSSSTTSHITRSLLSLSLPDSKAATTSSRQSLQSPQPSSLPTNSNSIMMNRMNQILEQKLKMDHSSKFLDWLVSSPSSSSSLKTASNLITISTTGTNPSPSKIVSNDLNSHKSIFYLLSNRTAKLFSENYYYLNYLKETNIIMRIWDVHPENWQIFLNHRYNRPQTLIAVYNANDLQELNRIRQPIEKYLKKLSIEQRRLLSIYIVGTKIDQGQTQPLTYGLRKWINDNRIRHLYISNLWNKGIDLLRSCLLDDIYGKHRLNQLFIHRDYLLDLYIRTIGYCPTIVYDSCIAFDNNNQIFTKSQRGGEFDSNNQQQPQSRNCHLCKSGSRPLRPIDFSRLKKDPKSMYEFHLALENICQCLDHLIFTTVSSQSSQSSQSQSSILNPLLTILAEQNKRKSIK